ncbi:Mg-dependent DNase [Myriangium duriaei CBS 260.36]|uniref:Mg-dependent DNase n=1 Tax=Myriangium duriaei CBS 260.36 TaxID=1168546 RepID=A0A9P4J163_9PEZI|nr:Mg-dependent DNase [Myriangium duriaei CBS 260.36]
MANPGVDWESFPSREPVWPDRPLQFADIAVTATANEFAGIYRNKQYHPADFHATLERAKAAGVEKVMLTGMSLPDIEFNTSIAKAHPKQCSVSMGIHPYHAAIPGSDIKPCMDQLAQYINIALAQDEYQLSAFGELGLDYDRLNHATKEDQIRVFKAQLDLITTHQWNLPLFLHCRAAFPDFEAIMTPYLPQLPRKGLVHSFVGSPAQMEKLVAMGLDISVNGFSFRDEESLRMVAAVPLDRLHLETDAPWGEVKTTSEVFRRYCRGVPALPAGKKRDKWDGKCMVKERNESCTISVVAAVVAGLKGVTVEEVADAAWRNSARMFGF